MLNDESHLIIFNTAGQNGDIGDKMKEVLRYMDDTKSFSVKDTHSEIIHMIDDKVSGALMSSDFRSSMMFYSLKQMDARIDGKDEGLIQGKAEGRTEGKVEERSLLVRSMLRNSIPVEKVCAIAGLSEDQVKQIASQP